MTDLLEAGAEPHLHSLDVVTQQLRILQDGAIGNDRRPGEIVRQPTRARARASGATRPDAGTARKITARWPNDILEIAETCTFEEIAHLLVHGSFPNTAELAGYSTTLKLLRGLSDPLRTTLEALPAAMHPMA